MCRSKESKVSDRRQDWTVADLIIPVLASALAIYYLTTIQDIPFMAQMYGGGLSILLLILSGIAILIMAIRLLVTKTASIRLDKGVVRAWARRYWRAGALVLLIVFFIVTVRFLGYTVVSLLFLSGAMYMLGSRGSIMRLIAPALIVTLIGYALFVLFLKVPLPLDPLSLFIKALV